MAEALWFGNGTYRRDAGGVWRYPWGDAVYGASDLTLADVPSHGPPQADGIDPDRPITDEDIRRAADTLGASGALVRRRSGGHAPRLRDVIVGMQAPELQVTTLLSAAQLAELAGVSKATLDTYRHRGLLPEPQVIVGRTPLWARPIATRWLAERPGQGWRTDLAGRRVKPGDRPGAGRLKR